MPRIPYPESEEGPVWEEIRAARGRVSKTFRLLGHSPLVQKLTLTKSETLEKRGVLGHRFHEAVAYTVSTQNGCLRWQDIHGRALRSEGLSDADLSAIEAGRAPAGFSPKEAALLAFLCRCNMDYEQVTDADVQAVLAAGVSYGELVEGIEGVNFSAAMNRWAHVLDVGLEGS